jgi:hypothetical protein
MKSKYEVFMRRIYLNYTKMLQLQLLLLSDPVMVLQKVTTHFNEHQNTKTPIDETQPFS